MTGQNVIVAPRSRAAIEALAVAVRRALGYDDNEKVSMLKVLEFQLPQILPDFEFAVEDDVVLGGADALTSMTDFSIVVSQTCYDQAYNRTSRRPQFTLAHELGHLLLHSGQSASFTRGVVKPYLSPEWQADCFAAAFLAPEAAVRRCRSIDEIVARFDISQQAAKLRVLKLDISFPDDSDTKEGGADR